MGKDRRKTIGTIGEQHAARILAKRGMKFVAANWRCRLGEVDLIYRDKDELVFIEVKTRLDSPLAEAYLFENITKAKKRKLRQLVDVFLAFYFHGKKVPKVRIDVVGVILGRNGFKLQAFKHLVGVI